jgi:hypothetical protein
MLLNERVRALQCALILSKPELLPAARHGGRDARFSRS